MFSDLGHFSRQAIQVSFPCSSCLAQQTAMGHSYMALFGPGLTMSLWQYQTQRLQLHLPGTPIHFTIASNLACWSKEYKFHVFAQFVTMTVILPSCVLTYLGQAAYMLENPEGYSNPYFNALPSWAFWPVLVIATLASIVSAQSLISGESQLHPFSWHQIFRCFLNFFLQASRPQRV